MVGKVRRNEWEDCIRKLRRDVVGFHARSYLELLKIVLAHEALKREEECLRAYLSSYEADSLYRDWPPGRGIGYVFETTLVYLIHRELLRARFPLEVRREEGYTQRKAMKADLAVRVVGATAAYIEVKIWRKEEAEDVEADLDKLRSQAAGTRSLVLLFSLNKEREQIAKNVDWLEKEFGATRQLRRVGGSPVDFETEMHDPESADPAARVRGFAWLALMEVAHRAGPPSAS